MSPGMLALAGVLSVLVGVSLGLLGGGGSILTVPLLVNVLGVDPKEAVTTSLVVVGVTSAVGALRHARAGNVQWRTGLTFGVAGMAGAWVGGKASALVSGETLMLLFAGMMLATATAMLRPRKNDEAVAPGPLWKVVRDGVAIGAVTGFVGAGGGFLVVPALALSGGLGMHHAIGTSLLVIAMQSTSGFLAHASDVAIDPVLTAVVAGAAVVGSFVGAALSAKVDPASLRKGFAVLVLVLGVVQLGLGLR